MSRYIRDINPTGDRVLVMLTQYEVNEKPGIVYVASNKRPTENRGLVLQVGPDVKNKDIQKNVFVYYSKQGIALMSESGKPLMILEESSIWGIEQKFDMNKETISGFGESFHDQGLNLGQDKV